MLGVDTLDILADRQAPDGPIEAERRRQWLGQQDAVDGVVARQRVEDRVERFLGDRVGLAADGSQAVPRKQALDLAQVRRRGRVLGRLDDRQAERRGAAGREAGGAALDVGPDRIGDRAPLQERGAQVGAPT